MGVYEKYDVDNGCLTKDYEKQGGLERIVIPGGGRRIEFPPKEDIIYLYLDRNMSADDMALLFNISIPKVYQILKALGIRKSAKNRRKNLTASLVGKYGIENPFYVGKFNDDVSFIIKQLEEHKMQFKVCRNTHQQKPICFQIPGSKYVIIYHPNEPEINKREAQMETSNLTELGLRPIHCWDYEFNGTADIVRKKIGLIARPTNIIYARKTELRQTSKEEKTVFLKTNHIQGNDGATVSYGLYYSGELVSLMTFCKPRFNTRFDWELSRFCTSIGCVVVGGGSKLLRQFERDYRPKNLITYSDFSLFDGDVYVKMGFTYKGLSDPNYKWVKGKTVLSRYQTQKHKLLAKGLHGETETEMMRKLGYKKVYDCGSKVWEKIYER